MLCTEEKKLKSLIMCAAAMAVSTLTSAPVRLTPPDRAADKLVAEALRAAPEVAAAKAAAEAAWRRIIPARTLPDPIASFNYQNDGRSLSLGSAEGSFLGVMLSQPLPWPGKLSLTGRGAESEAREVRSGTVGRAEYSIEARVRNAWYDLLLAHAVDRLLDDRRETASQIEATVRQRYAAGIAVQQDVLRAQVEIARLEEAKAAQQALITSRIAELNRLLARPQETPIESPSELPDAVAIPAISEIVTSVIARSPEMAAAAQGLETGRISVEIAKKNFLPDFIFSGGSMYRRSFEMGPMWQVGVGVSIPLWIDRRQRNQLAESEARLTSRKSENERIAQELEFRTRERVAQLDAANHVAALYHNKIVPLDELTLESALASYTAGKVPFITVLDALNSLYADRAAHLGRLNEAAKWRVAIDEAVLEPAAMSAAPQMPAALPANPSSMISMR